MFKHFMKSCSFVVALLLAVPQCTEPDPIPGGDPGTDPTPVIKKYLSLSIQNKDVDNAAGSFEVNITANVAWKAECSATWLSLSKTEAPRGEVITVMHEASSDPAPRTGEIRFSGEGVTTVALKVTQSGKFISIASIEDEADNAGATLRMKVSANCAWSVESGADWIVPTPKTGKSSATVTLTCAANPDASGKRKGEIRLKADGVSDIVCTVTQGRTFTNPIGGVPDPYIVKDGSDYYLVKAATGVNMSKSSKLSVLSGTKEVWRPDIDSKTAWNTSHVWAPEMHKVGGKWYIYYTAGRPSSESNGSYKLQRSGVLRAKTDDPLGQWEDMGMLYTGDNYSEGIVATASNTKYAIDLTVFELRGQLYAVWSGAAGPNDSNQSMYIATMSNPYTISCSRVRLSSAEQPWERQSSQIQEGPAILKRNGKIFIVYSCNGSWTKYYRLGYLVMDESKDPLDPKSWNKSPDQIFYRCDDTSVDAASDGVNGVGHCSFTVSPDGTEDWIVYHAKNRNDNTYTTGRSSYIKKFTWKADGTPDFGEPVGYKQKSIVPSGD